MGRKQKHNERLLEIAFSRGEWEYLKRNDDFKRELRKANLTLEDFHRISVAGSRLLQKWELKNPTKPKFKRSRAIPSPQKNKSKNSL